MYNRWMCFLGALFWGPIASDIICANVYVVVVVALIRVYIIASVARVDARRRAQSRVARDVSPAPIYSTISIVVVFSFHFHLKPVFNEMSYYSRSPPPLQHPVPTHPAFIPEPPSTPASPGGYQRYTSSPPQPGQQQHQSFVAPHTQPAATGYHPAFAHAQGAAPMQGMAGQGGVPYAAWGIDGATAQFGMQLGQNAMSVGQEYVAKNVRLEYIHI